jgi:hypothetical protein
MESGTTLGDRMADATIRLDPFPHIVVPDALDPGLYRQLCAGFPPFSRIGWSDPQNLPRSNAKFELSAASMIADPEMPDAWRRFAVLHSDRRFFDSVVALFAAHWPIALRQALGGTFAGHSIERLARHRPRAARIALDARIEINCPVVGTASSPLGPHLDTANRLYSGLLYMRHPEDDSTGGDLQLFRWKEGAAAPTSVVELPEEHLECVATIPSRATLLVFVPQGIEAIHGVSVRPPTRHFRRYVFITAELGEPWLTP